MMYNAKNFSGTVKEIDMNRRVVRGYFAIFDVKDSDEDIIRPGAFEQTIKERGPRAKNRIMHLLQHNPTQPLGKPQELGEDDTGLFFVTKITDTSYGTDALKLYRDGVFKEHSIGFNTIQSHFDDEANANILTELKLHEGSTVTWGAQEMATGELMKGMFKRNELLERYNELTKAFYRGDYTDDTFSLIQKQRDYIETQLKEVLEGEKPEPSRQPRSEVTTSHDIKELFTKHTLENKIRGKFNGI